MDNTFVTTNDELAAEDCAEEIYEYLQNKHSDLPIGIWIYALSLTINLIFTKYLTS